MSGMNFYLRQANGGTTKGKRTSKVKKKLKKDWIAEINSTLGADIAGLDKCTIKTLENLLEAIKSAHT